VRSLRSPALAAAAIALLAACGKSSNRQAAESKPQPQARRDAASLPAQAATAPPIDEAAAQKLLKAWLESQEKGDFAAYAHLYAGGFSGVRTSGKKRVTLDRDGWLAERKKMFSRPMTVDTSDLKVTGGAEARLSFTQYWESGRYADLGTKTMVLRYEGADLRIASEEMVSSLRVPTRKQCYDALTLPSLGRSGVTGYDHYESQLVTLGKDKNNVACVVRVYEEIFEDEVNIYNGESGLYLFGYMAGKPGAWKSGGTNRLAYDDRLAEVEQERKQSLAVFSAVETAPHWWVLRVDYKVSKSSDDAETGTLTTSIHAWITLMEILKTTTSGHGSLASGDLWKLHRVEAAKEQTDGHYDFVVSRAAGGPAERWVWDKMAYTRK